MREINTLVGATNLSKIRSGNVALKPVEGGKRTDVISFAHHVAKKFSHVETVSRNTLNIQGDIVSTGSSTDFVVNSTSGMAAVEVNGKVACTVNTSCTIDKDGFLVNAPGHYMMGWAYDDNGSLDSRLTRVNLNSLTSRARATSTVSIAANLSADPSFKALKGPGEQIKLSKLGLNSGTKITDVIIPERLPGTSGSFLQGDTFKLQSPPGNEATYEFGGIAVGRQITGTNPLYGATITNGTFVVNGNPTVEGVNIQAGQGITITLTGAAPQIFTAAVAPSTASNEFNSLSSLVAKINKVDGLTARIGPDGRLYIASKDGNKGITFNDGGSGMKRHLGLTDVSDNTAGVNKRFSTLDSLKRQINAGTQITGVSAEAVDGAIDIHSQLATDQFLIKGESYGVTRFQNAIIGPAYQGDAPDRSAAQYTIESPNHGLRVGDFIQINVPAGGNTGNAQIVANRYMVTKIGTDSFSINAKDPANANFPVINNGNVLAGVDATWQKVAGVAPTAAGVIIGNNGEQTPNAVAMNANDVRLTLGGGYAAGDYAVNDVVYISGFGTKRVAGGNDITVPDGYYHITAINQGAGQIEFTPSNNVVHAAAPNAVPGDIRVRKIASGDASMNTPVMTTIGGANSTSVKLFIPHNNYSQDDFIKLSGLAAPLALDGLTINNDEAYEITAVDPNGEWVIFDVGAGHGVTVNGNEGATTQADVAAYTNDNYNAVANNITPVGNAFTVNNYSRTFKDLGLNQSKFTFDATYADTETLSLAKQDQGRVYTKTFTVFDSQGVGHELELRFAKLKSNQWAVEIGGVQDPVNNDYPDLQTTRTDGVLKAGTLLFHPDGSFQAATNGMDGPIEIRWSNGSDTSLITIDWENNLQSGPGAKQGIRQNDGQNTTFSLSPNGNASGLRNEVSIDENGVVTGIFSNGGLIKLYQLPIITVPNINGLEASDGGIYNITTKSGPMNIQKAGPGIGTFTAGVVQFSNVDSNEELVNLMGDQIYVQSVARTLTVHIQDEQNILAETRR